MDRKIKIMVGSTVYGFENELYLNAVDECNKYA